MANKLELIYLNLANMLAAGVPVIKALRTAGSAGKWRHRKAFNRLADLASQGEGLADGMEQNKRVFKRLDAQLVRVGEEAGGLPRILKELSGWYGLSNRLQRTIKARLYFPLMQLHFVAVFVPGILYFMHEFSKGSLGFPADKAISLGLVILSIMYVPALISFLIIRYTPQTGLLRLLLDSIVQFIPILGYAVRHLAYSRYFRNFQLCLNAGMPIGRTCEIACAATGNGVVALRFKGGIQAVQDGKDVSEGFRRLPDEIMHAWLTGEQTGDLDIVCGRLADQSTEHAERAFKTVADWIPRLIYGMIAMIIIYFIFQFLQIYLSAVGAAFSG